MVPPSFNQFPNPQQSTRAWKFDGYPKFTTWQASSRDVAIFRRFGPLSTRCALYMQDELVQLEERIEKIDQACTQFGDYGRNDSFRFDKEKQQNDPNDPHAVRRSLMDQAVVLSKQYHDYLESWGKLRALPRAEPRQTQNIKNWFANHPNAVSTEERAWVQKDGDLVAVAAVRKPPVERWLLRRGQWLKALFREKKIDWLHVESATTTYSDDRMIQAFANAAVAIMGLLFLVVPMAALTYMTVHGYSFPNKTGVIIAAVVFASVALSVVSDQKAFQVLLASAAYAAVLLIYLQIGGSNAAGGGGGGAGNSSANLAGGAAQVAAAFSKIEIAYTS